MESTEENIDRNQENSKRWEWNYLRDKCQNLDLEEHYNIYQMRLAITDVSLLMFADFMLVLTHITLLFTTVAEKRYYIFDVCILIVTLLMVFYFVRKGYKKHLIGRNPNKLYCTNGKVVSIIMLRDIIIVIYHQLMENVSLNFSYDIFLIIFIYFYMPFPNRLFQFLFALTATTLYSTITLITRQTWILPIFLNIYYLSLHIIGYFYVMCREYDARVSVLNRYKFLEHNMLLSNIVEKENAMIETILPAKITHNMQQDVRNRIKANINKSQNTSIINYTQSYKSSLYIEPHSSVSILFATLIKFMDLTTSISVNTLVTILNEIFLDFDAAARNFNVLKIQCFGESYKCVSGLPLNNTNHAKCCVDMGMKMIDIISEMRYVYAVDFDIRIGVHSGEAFSGVIGSVKWQYDVWSKNVDIAQCLEQLGRPGFVHISDYTLSKLDNDYNYEVGPIEALEDLTLQKYNILTYIVLQIKFPLKGYPSKAQTFDDAPLLIEMHLDRPTTCRPSTFTDNYESMKNSVKIIALTRMNDEVEKMPIGRIQMARLFDYSQKPEPLKCEDQEFQKRISFLCLMFRKRTDELIFMNEPDYLIQYTAILVFIIAILIVVECRKHATFMQNSIYYIIVCILLSVLCIILMYKKLWIMFVSTSTLVQPKYRISMLFYKVGDMAQKHLLTRFFVYFCLIAACFALCSIQVIHCNVNEFNLLIAEAQLYDSRDESKFCFDSTVYCNSMLLVLLMSFCFQNLPLALIVITSVILFCSFLIQTLGQYGFVFEQGYTSNVGFRAEYSNCFDFAGLFLILFLKERKKLFIAKFNYISKKRILRKKNQIIMTTQSVNFILHNILPVHVSEKYINNRQEIDLIIEELPKVAIMFASLKNYDPERINIRHINEIICNFDNLLDKYNGLVEKIKVTNWTYMAACGLDLSFSDSLSKMSSVYSKTLATEQSHHSYINEILSKFNYFSASSLNEKENVVALIMTEFALDLLRVISSQYMRSMFFKSRRSNPEILQIGISHGPAMAGIVGRSKPHYDIWGKTVNMASIMNLTGKPDMIQVTDNTAQILQGYDIRCDYRGMITYGNADDEIPTYFVAHDKFNFISIKKISYPNQDFRRQDQIKQSVDFKIKPDEVIHKSSNSETESDSE